MAGASKVCTASARVWYSAAVHRATPGQEYVVCTYAGRGDTAGALAGATHVDSTAVRRRDRHTCARSTTVSASCGRVYFSSLNWVSIWTELHRWRRGGRPGCADRRQEPLHRLADGSGLDPPPPTEREQRAF